MPVAQLFNVPVTKEDAAAWSAVHMAHHFDLNAGLLAKFSVVLPAFALDPFRPDDPGLLLLHQTMHDNNDALLAISGFNLQEVNWADPSQRAAWVWLNAQLHYQEAAGTGMW